MADMSVSGVASGMDWDGMVTKLIEKAKAPAYVMVDKRDKLEGKKSLFEEFRVALQGLQTKLSPLKLASTFKAKQVEIERIDSNVNYKSVLTATVNADAEINVHDLEVLKLAKGQTQRSKQISGALGSTLLNGATSSYFYVNAGGKNVRIEVKSDDTLDSLAKRINTNLKGQTPPVSVTASVIDNRLILKSDNTGLGKSSQNATVKRSANSYDTLDFNVDLSQGNGGTLVLKGKNSAGADATFKEGVDFDIVGGNQIRWRMYEPQSAPAGNEYQVTYVAKAGETVTQAATRAASGNLDAGVFSLDTTTHPGVLTIKSGGVTYSQSTDFTVEGNDIRWVNGRGPAYGASYDISYEVAADGESFVLNVNRNAQDTISGSVYADYATGVTTIRKGNKTYVQGVDFDIVKGSSTQAVVQWRKEAGFGAPAPGDSYDITLKKADGTSVPATAVRGAADSVNLEDYGLKGAGGVALAGSIGGIKYNGNTFTPAINPSAANSFEFTWTNASSTTARNNVPKYDTDYTVEYTYNANTFNLDDGGNGILSGLGLDSKTDEDYTAACDAELMLNGEKVTRSSNSIGADYKNELIKGVTLQLKGLGRVSLDVSQNAESAVTALQDFLTSYNDIMKWINTRLTEKELDETKKATLDSDDFRMKWGLLAGSSLLRETKDAMRRLTSQVIAMPFTARTSRQPVYGTMAQNGIVNAGSFTIQVGARISTISVRPEDTLETIAAKINSNDPNNGEAKELHYDPDGREYPTPFIKASVENNKLVLTAGTDRSVTLGGSAVLKALGLNYEYASFSQIGVKLKSTGGGVSEEGKIGQLDFDTSVFMAALEANAEDTSMFVTAFAGQMQTYLDNMIKSTGKEVAQGVTAAQGSVVREIDAIDSEIKSIDKYLVEFERRLKTKQEGLYAQFAAAEVNLAKMMQQASWLSSVTSQLQQAAAK